MRQAGVTPQLLQQTMQQCLAGRGRRLFQPMPYTQQEQAQVQASDVAAVVEVMCGKPSPAAPSAITGAVGLDEPDAYWQPPGSMEAAGNALQQPLLLLYQHTSNLGGAQQQQQQQRHVESIGQISSCILMKLVVDLWLTAGGAAALPLVLRMLQQALYQLQPQYRARAFDIIYNLALHGTMLMPATTAVSLPPSPALDTSRSAAPPPLSAALSPLQQQQQQQQQVYGTVDSPGGLDTQQQQAAGTYVQAGFGAAPSPPQSPSSYAAQQQQSSPGPPAVSSSWSPQPSPRARSRLSRSQLAWMAPADSLAPLQQQQQSVPPPLPLQQQGAGATGGPSASGSSNAMTGAGAAAPPPAGDGPAAGGGGSGRAARGMAAVREGSSGSEAGDAGSIGGGAAAVVPVEVAWEAWLQQLLFELLLLLSMVSKGLGALVLQCSCVGSGCQQQDCGA
jgi:hypothetical protein